MTNLLIVSALALLCAIAPADDKKPTDKTAFTAEYGPEKNGIRKVHFHSKLEIVDAAFKSGDEWITVGKPEEAKKEMKSSIASHWWDARQFSNYTLKVKFAGTDGYVEIYLKEAKDGDKTVVSVSDVKEITADEYARGSRIGSETPVGNTPAQGQPGVVPGAQPGAVVVKPNVVGGSGDPTGFTDILNAERARRGLQAVAYDAELSRQASINSQRGGHSYMGSAMSQNWAGVNDPQQAFQMWMNSTGHRNNMLNPNLRSVGFGQGRTGATMNGR